MKSNNKNFVHLAGLYTYCRMMHGTYNVKLINLTLYIIFRIFPFILSSPPEVYFLDLRYKFFKI